MKGRVFLLATLALVGVVAFAAGSVASAKPALADGKTLTRWVDGRFTPDFLHNRFAASFSTDLAPGEGLAAYQAARPAAAATRHGLPPCRRAGARRVPHRNSKGDRRHEQEAQDHGRSPPAERQRRSVPSH